MVQTDKCYEAVSTEELFSAGENQVEAENGAIITLILFDNKLYCGATQDKTIEHPGNVSASTGNVNNDNDKHINF